VGDEPTFFVCGGRRRREEVIPMSAQGDIERRVVDALAQAMPEVDLLELSVLPAKGGTLRLVVDHPGGVDHGVCAGVTGVLQRAGLLDHYGAEVWSPGPEPPLRTPEHFRRAVGRRVRVRAEAPDGRRSFTGTLVEADDRALRLSLGDAEVEIPLSEVRRARALETTEAAG
jgi:ribosome maturation factor RimP